MTVEGERQDSDVAINSDALRSVFVPSRLRGLAFSVVIAPESIEVMHLGRMFAAELYDDEEPSRNANQHSPSKPVRCLRQGPTLR
jgi:hypothetical protein